MWRRRDELGRGGQQMESGALMYEWRTELLANKRKRVGGKSKSQGQGMRSGRDWGSDRARDRSPAKAKRHTVKGELRVKAQDCTHRERPMATWMLLNLKLLLPSTRLVADRRYGSTSPVAHQGSPGRC